MERRWRRDPKQSTRLPSSAYRAKTGIMVRTSFVREGACIT